MMSSILDLTKSDYNDDYSYDVRQGALLLADKDQDDNLTGTFTPYYLVDLYDNGITPFCNCFELDKESLNRFKKNRDIDTLKKAYEIKKDDKDTVIYRRETKLGQDLIPKDKATTRKTRYLIKKPLFTSLICKGTSTITGDYTNTGFFEKTARDKSTNIFIALEDINWYRTVREDKFLLYKYFQVATKNINREYNVDITQINPDLPQTGITFL